MQWKPAHVVQFHNTAATAAAAIDAAADADAAADVADAADTFTNHLVWKLLALSPQSSKTSLCPNKISRQLYKATELKEQTNLAIIHCSDNCKESTMPGKEGAAHVQQKLFLKSFANSFSWEFYCC